MNLINQRQDEIIEEFSDIDDWMDKYNYLIELSHELPQLDAKYKTDAYLIDGCQSRVWINAEIVDGVMKLSAESDAIIAKGLVALLVRVFDGISPQEIKDCELYFIDKIGLSENLTPTRANGLLSMVKRIKMFALAYTK
ncbi:MAG: SufE family protein [Rikenellaceae bacterium]